MLSDGFVHRVRAPADGGCDLAGDRLEHRGVVVDAELAGHRQEERVGGQDGRVLGQLFGDAVGLSGVAAAEPADRAVEPADLVLVRVGAEEPPVEVGGDRDDAAADRDARLARVAGLRPGFAEQLDLLGLELVERHLRVLEQER